MDWQLYENTKTRHCANVDVSASGSYPTHLHTSLSPENGERAIADISCWADYKPTPLRDLPKIAEAAGVARVYYKDESGRFGLGSFKALGGAYAVSKLVAKSDNPRDITVVSATDGNHGRAVAWGAKQAGCQCRIYIHAAVSEQRQQAIESLGATVIRIDGNYDDSVRLAADDADKNGWTVVADTATGAGEEMPGQVMAGYCTMAEETLQQLPSAPTHVFVQGGVGGLAAAICGWFWHKLGKRRPDMTIVEPSLADCLYQSARQRQLTPVEIEEETLMAGLSCGEPSAMAWPVLRAGAHHFMTIEDEAIPPLMRYLAGEQIESGESGVAGLAGLLAAAKQSRVRNDICLNGESHVVVFGTEGATDADIYARIVGAHPHQ